MRQLNTITQEQYMDEITDSAWARLIEDAAQRITNQLRELPETKDMIVRQAADGCPVSTRALKLYVEESGHDAVY